MSSEPQATVALVVVNYGTPEDTVECVESALLLQLPDAWAVRLIVVDNNSPDDSWAKLLNWAHGQPDSSRAAAGVVEVARVRLASPTIAECTLLHAKENRGYAAGVNLGVRYAQSHPDVRYVWILNSDTVLAEDSLLHLLNAAAKDGGAIFGTTLLYHDDPEVVQAAGGARYLPILGRSRHIGKRCRVSEVPQDPALDYIIGASMFCPVTIFDRVGLMPEEFFLYFEETEWCARARDCGVALRWIPEARVIHKEGKSTGASGRFRRLSDLAFYYMVRNSFIYTARRHRVCLPSVLAYNLLESLRYCVRGDAGKLRVFWRACLEFWSMRHAADKV